MNIEGIQPNQEALEQSSDKNVSGFEFRTLKNSERGTEIGYATIKLEDVNSPDFPNHVRSLLDKFYDLQGEDKPDIPDIPDDPNRMVNVPSYESARRSYVKFFREFVASTKEEVWGIIGPRQDDPNHGVDEKKQYLFLVKKMATKLLILPQPFINGMFSSRFGAKNPFENLLSILDRGFFSERRDGNTKRKLRRDHIFNPAYVVKMKGEAGDIRNGDSYSVELFPEEGHDATPDYVVHKASPNRISSVNIMLDELVSSEEKEKKMSYYRKIILEKYKVPVRFFVSSGSDEQDNSDYPVAKPTRIYPKAATKDSLEETK
ncbi:MAG TPA: hypothetical protein PKA60_01500 [Candidatus Paceibacterota bacterium]|nr:hypothetical protein [Candidatus Paceibacterota bacterium]